MSAGAPSGAETGQEREARVERLRRLREARDGENQSARLSDEVQKRLDHLWRTGGRDDSAAVGPAPRTILVRPKFLYDSLGADPKPVLPLLQRNQGLALRLELLLLLFDAQCRHAPGSAVSNVRSIARRADDTFASWRELVLTDAHTGGRRGKDGRMQRNAAQLRLRQITDALVVLESLHLVAIPRRERSGNRRYRDFALLSEAGSSEAPAYLVPNKGIDIPPEFFTNLWVWVLSDAEIATYLMLRTMRNKRPGKHTSHGVFVTSGYRESVFRLQRATWRSADTLHRLRLIDRLPSAGRNFRTGKTGDPAQLAPGAKKRVVRYRLNDEALKVNALSTAWQVLTEPTEKDRCAATSAPWPSWPSIRRRCRCGSADAAPTVEKWGQNTRTRLP